jgi:hypothetical protein
LAGDAFERLHQSRLDLARQILASACTMIGMCATLVGLVKFLQSRSFDTLVDEFSALIGIVFLFSAILSYVSLRHAHRAHLSDYVGRVADVTFILGLLGLAGAVVFLAFELI